MRIGHPARLLESVLDASLEAQVLKSDNSALARDCEKEYRSSAVSCSNSTRGRTEPRETTRGASFEDWQRRRRRASERLSTRSSVEAT